MIEVDERTVTVDQAAGLRGYRVMSWLLVLDLGLHGLRLPWLDWNGFPLDIPVILLGGELARTWHLWRSRTLTRRLIFAASAAAGAAFVMAAVLTLLRGLR
ncbi:MAG: hypothetical protein ACYC5Y_03280 [Symbiobacteriia bacterium]